MTLMDRLVTAHTEDLHAHLADAATVPESDLEGRRESQSSPPGANLGAPPALPAEDWSGPRGIGADGYGDT